VFEWGLGGSELYGATPAKMFSLLSGYGLQVSLLERWLRDRGPLTEEQFADQFNRGLNFFFIAY